ncbi:MAG: HIT family protein [Candidatus Woesearchaeota archaeon]|jgi:diadenosine tetraphosphate (Ap4A) HIT family hydrolase
MKSNDVFCKLYDVWKRDGKILFENDHAYSIFSVTPATPGHSIVIAKEHVERLEELRGHSLEGFVDAIPATLLAVQGIYDSDPERIVQFYQSLRENPPVLSSVDAAVRMLQDHNLRVKPDSAYNVGINVGEYAGQLVSHLHAQLFPRRERGPGIVTAMEELFRHYPLIHIVD